MFNVFPIKRLELIISLAFCLVFISIPAISIIESNPLLLIVNKTTIEDFLTIIFIFVLVPLLTLCFILLFFKFLNIQFLYWIFIISLSLYWITASNFRIIFDIFDNLNYFFILISSLLLYLVYKKINTKFLKNLEEFSFVLVTLSFAFIIYQIGSLSELYQKRSDPDLYKNVPTNLPSIVLIILDEFSFVDFSRANEKILPNIYDLKGTSINFTKAYSAADTTYQSIPAMLSDGSISHLKLPFTNHYPKNILAILKNSHKIYALEPITLFCTNKLCQGQQRLNYENIKLMIKDISFIFFQKYFPFEGIAPTLGNKVNHFFLGRWYSEEIDQRITHIQNFNKSLPFKDNEKKMIFAHYLLPHAPYMYDQDCAGYKVSNNINELGDGYEWKTSQIELNIYYYRFLHQLKCADKMVGQLLNKLKESQMYEDALIILTADHGVHFKINENRRVPSEKNYDSLAHIPLIIKLPKQTNPVQIDRFVTNGQLDDFILSNLNLKSLEIEPKKYNFYSTKLLKNIQIDLTQIKTDQIELSKTTDLNDYYASKFKPLNNFQKNYRINNQNKKCGVVVYNHNNITNDTTQLPLPPCIK